jgi:hypothetical protein
MIIQVYPGFFFQPRITKEKGNSNFHFYKYQFHLLEYFSSKFNPSEANQTKYAQ